MRDIYDPPPAPVALESPKPAPLVMTRGDWACLVAFSLLLGVAAVLAGRVEPNLTPLVGLGGGLVILESWSTALGFLNRRPADNLRGRWVIFLAALLPWLVGLGIAASLMLALFRLSDRFG